MKRKRPAKRKQRPPPAPTWDGLAAELAVNVRGIHRLRFEPGAPKTPAVEDWRTFMAARVASGAAGEKVRSTAELDREQADLRYARARAATAEREDAIAAGLVVTKAQATAAAALVRDAFIAEGLVLPSSVAGQLPKLSKTDKLAVEEAVRAAWSAACERIASGTSHG